MTETTRESQIRLKVGQIEVEFKGTEEFIKKELKEFVTSIADLHKSTGIIAAPVNEGPVPATLKPVSSTNGNLSDETIESLAKKLGCKNTADLVRIAAA